MNKIENYIERLSDEYRKDLSGKYNEAIFKNIYNRMTDNLPVEVGQETLTNGIETYEHLSKTFKMPLKISGTFIREGKPKNRFYRGSEIEIGIQRTQGILPIPIYNDHKEMDPDMKIKSTGNIIGAITKVHYNAETKSGLYEGHINDEKNARNVFDGVVKEISATIVGKNIYSEHGVEGTTLTFTEISLVNQGSELNNTLEVV